MFSKNLKYYRLMKSLSKKELANKVDVTPMAISNYESGIRKPEMDILKKIAEVLDNFEDRVQEKPKYIYPEDIERAHITVGSSAYIKIAEGCDYACGYCVIPKLRGKYVSRKIEDIVLEAKNLAKKGIAEVILIAQDTTNYGRDIYGEPSLHKLLRELNKLDEISWIRVLYAYPTNFTDELISAYKNLDKVVKYVDIPLQHSHPAMLKRMCRPVQNYEELIKKIRKAIPDVCRPCTYPVLYGHHHSVPLRSVSDLYKLGWRISRKTARRICELCL